MIERLSQKDYLDVYEIANSYDKYKDCYITKNRERIFFTDFDFVKKILKTQEVYGYKDGSLHGFFVIYREKGFRPYIKLVAKNYKYVIGLLKYLAWNFSIELYMKVKKTNPIVKIAQKYGFIFSGSRGSELLLIKKKKENSYGYRSSKSA